MGIEGEKESKRRRRKKKKKGDGLKEGLRKKRRETGIDQKK